jgi:Rhodopirellula transposase DDE domain
MHDAAVIERIRRKFRALTPLMDERTRRHWAASEARELSWGGVTCVAKATGLSRTTIAAGIADLKSRSDETEPSPRIRRPGGGRKPLDYHDPGLWAALDALVDPVTRGDPETPLRWTCKSTRRLAQELCRQNHPISPGTVASMLRDLGYSLQANRKTREGENHPDRNAQFELPVRPTASCGAWYAGPG